MNDTLTEIPSKLLLIVDSIHKGNEEVKQLLRLLIAEIRKSREERLTTTDKMMDTIVTRLDTYATSISESIKSIAEDSTERRNSNHKIQKARKILVLWNGTLNSRKQAFWDHYRAHRTSQVFLATTRRRTTKNAKEISSEENRFITCR